MRWLASGRRRRSEGRKFVRSRVAVALAVAFALVAAMFGWMDGSPQSLPPGTYTLTVQKGSDIGVVTVRYVDASHWEVKHPADEWGTVEVVVMDGDVFHFRSESRSVSEELVAPYGLTVEEFMELPDEEQEALLGEPPWSVDTNSVPAEGDFPTVPDFALMTPDQLGDGFRQTEDDVYVRHAANGFIDTFVYRHDASPVVASHVLIEAPDGTVSETTIEFVPPGAG